MKAFSATAPAARTETFTHSMEVNLSGTAGEFVTYNVAYGFCGNNFNSNISTDPVGSGLTSSWNAPEMPEDGVLTSVRFSGIAINGSGGGVQMQVVTQTRTSGSNTVGNTLVSDTVLATWTQNVFHRYVVTPTAQVLPAGSRFGVVLSRADGASPVTMRANFAYVVVYEGES